MSILAEDIREKLMYFLKNEEERTDLENMAVLSRVGMKISTAYTYVLDADAISASSTALIDLGLRLSEATNHGALREIILHNLSGYCILMAINDEYIIFGGLSAIHRVGYYLEYIRELAKKLNRLISGDEETEMTLTLEQTELEKIQKQKIEEQIEEETLIIKPPSVEEDKAALDGLLGFLDDWEKEGADFEALEQDNATNIVSIPKTKIPEAGIAPQNTQIITEETTKSAEFKVYEDEVPPIPLDDYTPMEMEERESEQGEQKAEVIPPPPKEYAQEYDDSSISIPSLEKSSTKFKAKSNELPTLDNLVPPDFESEGASEYQTEFILEEESESLDAVLKDLGWDLEEE
ncbi:MAG: hypothetical protein KGD63_06070 [Candidatus Lokiarchaeota archaeon]|nr:hypothetical protein [Candidatus Lokiarchaeota archaeon]